MAENGSKGLKSTRILKVFLVAALTVMSFGVGYYLSGPAPEPKADHTGSQVGKAHPQKEGKTLHRKKETLYTCVMHPQIIRSEPGDCPICGMELVPVVETKESADKESIRYTMTEKAKMLARVETAEVRRGRARVELPMVGMVFEDETRIAALTSRVDGRLDEIHVDFTGVKVKKGDPLVTIWSPTLIRSQVELFETIRSPEFGKSVVKGAEEKLKQFGLTDKQIEQIRKRKKPMLYITLRAPISGIVTKKNAILGHFVKEGTVMYEIVDLSKVWVKLDAYERDLPWIRYGQRVTFTTLSVPGRTFTGTVLFIDPVLQMDTRSVKIRVEADNPDLLLKPHMFVSAVLEAEVDAQGRVIKPEWAGKYICPVHPDEVSSTPGICPRSKRPLQPAADFGYSPDPDPLLPLVIPASAVLYTGKRSIVYVEVPSAPVPTYEQRDIVLGPRAGNEYIVYGGLREGERVVTKGNFKIDSAAQILAKTSMMNRPRPQEPKREAARRMAMEERVEAPPGFGKALAAVVEDYLRLKDAFVRKKGHEGMIAQEMMDSLKSIDPNMLGRVPRSSWKDLAGRMTSNLERIVRSKDRDERLRAFRNLSEAFAATALGFWYVMEKPLYIFRCSTLFHGKGAYWAESRPKFTNPYADGKKRRCGELVAKVPAGAPKSPEGKGSTKGKPPMDMTKSTEGHGSGAIPGKPSIGSGSKTGQDHKAGSSSKMEGHKPASKNLPGGRP